MSLDGESRVWPNSLSSSRTIFIECKIYEPLGLFGHMINELVVVLTSEGLQRCIDEWNEKYDNTVSSAYADSTLT